MRAATGMNVTLRKAFNNRTVCLHGAVFCTAPDLCVTVNTKIKLPNISKENFGC